MGNEQTITFTDSCVLYYSKTDDSWIAHSLHTDQIGTGDNLIDALIDILQGLDNLLSLSKKDNDIALFREAPADIQRLARKAKPLPKEINQIALRKIHGDWPKGLKLIVQSAKNSFLCTEISEPLFS